MSEVATMEPNSGTATDQTPETADLKLPDLQVFDGQADDQPHESAANDSPAEDTGAGTAVGQDEAGDQPVESTPATTAGDATSTTAPVVDAPAVGRTVTAHHAAPAIRTSIIARFDLEYEIRNQQIKVAGLASSWSKKQAAAKHAKKEFDLEVENLRDMEQRLERGEFGLPFQGYVDTGSTSSGTSSGTSAAPLPGQQELPLGESGAEATTTDQPDDAWRAVTLAELSIKGKLAESLTDAGLTTLGALADYTAADKRLTDIAGIGAGKAAKIEEATLAYWATAGRSRPCAEACAGAGTETGDSDTKSDENAQKTARGSGDQKDDSLKATAAGAENADEIAAYTAGADGMLAATEAAGENGDPVMPKNPHKKNSRIWHMFDKGVQDILAN